MYQERMIGYYPQVIQSILEFQSIIDSEYPEIEGVKDGVDRVTLDAYLTTMSEERIAQWEKILGIKPLDNSTISDRRDTIIARIRGQGKLNEDLINRIVSSFTGGTASVWISGGKLYIEVHIPVGNKDYKFANLEQELASKIPAHLEFEIVRERVKWGELRNTHKTWEDILITHDDWTDVMFGIHRVGGVLNYTPIEKFVLV